MAFTFRRASKAMLATSSTTAAAFLATGFSKIMPISSFGFFAGILVPVNYLLVISYFPTLLIIYEKYTKNMCVKKETSTEVRERRNSLKVSKREEKEIKQKEHSIVLFFGN